MFVVAEVVMITLTWRDPALKRLDQKIFGVALIVAAALLGSWRFPDSGLPPAPALVLAAAVVLAACIFTGGRPAQLYCASVKRHGRTDRGLLARRISGVIGVAAATPILLLLVMESLGVLQFF